MEQISALRLTAEEESNVQLLEITDEVLYYRIQLRKLLITPLKAAAVSHVLLYLIVLLKSVTGFSAIVPI